MSRVRVLTPTEFEAEAGESFRRVFSSADPFDAPFTREMAGRAIFFSGFKLEPGPADALAAAARSVGDRGFYITMTSRRGEQSVAEFEPTTGTFIPADTVRPQEWFISLENLDAYLDSSPSRLPLNVENVLLSPSGQWGAIFSNEHHVVIGGVGTFTETLLDEWPDATLAPDGGRGSTYSARESVLAWLRYLKWDRDQLGLESPDWLRDLLRHVYGDAEADRLLQVSGIT